MQQNIPLIYDLIFLLLFAVVAVRNWHRGFLASLAELIGAIFGVGIAVWASQTAAPQIFSIEPRTVKSLKLFELKKADDPSPFPALTQIEAWGTEA